MKFNRSLFSSAVLLAVTLYVFFRPSEDVPQWFVPVMTLVVGALLGVGIMVAQRTSARLRADLDPKNDWIADLLDTAVELGQQGRHVDAHDLIEQAATLARAKRSRPRQPVPPSVKAARKR